MPLRPRRNRSLLHQARRHATRHPVRVATRHSAPHSIGPPPRASNPTLRGTAFPGGESRHPAREGSCPVTRTRRFLALTLAVLAALPALARADEGPVVIANQEKHPYLTL